MKSNPLFSAAQVARLTGASTGQLRRWNQNGMLPARRHPGGRPAYDFTDVIAARTAISLIGNGVSSRQVREAVEAVRGWRPEMDNPLASLRVFSDGSDLVVRLDDTLINPRSGQVLLALPVGALADAANEFGDNLVSGHWSQQPKDAQAWLTSGLDAENSGDTAQAERCYRSALDADADHPGVLINLGNIEYDRGELRAACDHYRRATQLAPDYPDAWYNLANALDDLGHVDAALSAYQSALGRAGDFADAHFNLALLWEKLGQRDRARPHWHQFVTLAPESDSIGIAQRFIDDLSSVDEP